MGCACVVGALVPIVKLTSGIGMLRTPPYVVCRRSSPSDVPHALRDGALSFTVGCNETASPAAHGMGGAAYRDTDWCRSRFLLLVVACTACRHVRRALRRAACVCGDVQCVCIAVYAACVMATTTTTTTAARG